MMATADAFVQCDSTLEVFARPGQDRTRQDRTRAACGNFVGVQSMSCC
jgi:hypothetical protein